MVVGEEALELRLKHAEVGDEWMVVGCQDWKGSSGRTRVVEGWWRLAVEHGRGRRGYRGHGRVEHHCLRWSGRYRRVSSKRRWNVQFKRERE